MHDYNLFADIKKLLIESHTKEEIKDLSTSELKKLHKEYLAKGTVEAKEEAAEIKKEIESRGEDDDSETKSETKLDEEDNRASPIFNTHKPVQNWNRVADYYSILAKREAARRAEVDKEMAERKAKAEAAKKKPVAEQNEELLAILDTLCEMAGLDMVALMEQMTRKDFENWGRAEGWNKPAPAAAPHGKLAANARDILVKAGMARGTRSERIAREREQFRAGPDFAERMADAGQDNVHETDKGVVTGLKALRGFDQIQSDIDDLAHKSRRAEEGKKSEMSPTMKAHVENLRRLAKPAAKKTKGKGKQNKIGSMELFGFEKMQGNKPRGKGKKK